MVLSIGKPLLILAGAGGAAGGYICLDGYEVAEDTIAPKSKVTNKEIKQISSFEDIMTFQKSKGCFFGFVENWGEKKIGNALKIKEIIKQEASNKGKPDHEIQKFTSLFTFLNGTEKSKCISGAHLTYSYKNAGGVHTEATQTTTPVAARS